MSQFLLNLHDKHQKGFLDGLIDMPEAGSSSRWEEDRAGRYVDHSSDLRGKGGSRRRHEAPRPGANDRASSSSSRQQARRSDGYNGRDDRPRRRSRSPDFARDRAREREAYDRKYSNDVHGISPSREEKTISEEPDFKPSGLLAKESNSKNGITLKYFEPPEARKPKKKWRLYVFKDGKEIDMLHISRQSCYLIGRDAAVADIPVDHVSVSKQHCVIQYRSQTDRNEYGDEKRTVKPFLIDLDSANGSFVNKVEVPPSRYYELKNGDAITLGGSEREYIVLMED